MVKHNFGQMTHEIRIFFMGNFITNHAYFSILYDISILLLQELINVQYAETGCQNMFECSEQCFHLKYETNNLRRLNIRSNSLPYKTVIISIRYGLSYFQLCFVYDLYLYLETLVSSSKEKQQLLFNLIHIWFFNLSRRFGPSPILNE